MKYRVLRPLSDCCQEVMASDGLRWLFTAAFPEDQKDLFDQFQRGLSMDQAESLYREQARDYQHMLDLIGLRKEDSHLYGFEEYEVRSIPGGTGWQVDVLGVPMLSLGQLRRYHTLSVQEERLLADQVVDALREAKKAGIEAGSVDEDHVFVDRENEFMVKVIPGEVRDGLEDVALLVRDEGLRQELSSHSLWTWQ